MTLALSSHDQSLVAAATRALVSPLVAPSFESWLAEVNRTLKELLWADMASFMFPVGGGQCRTVSAEAPSAALQCFMREKQPEIERRWGIRTRSLELGVFSRGLLYGSRLPELYRSDYYNEYLVPNRAHDVLGMTMALDAPDRVVNLYFHHERPTGRRFGTRGRSIARMLFPAFKAGVHASHSLFQRRYRLAHLADAMPVGVALADGNGRVVHRNPALVGLLRAGDHVPRVEQELRAAARECASVATGSRSGPFAAVRRLPDARRLRREVAAATGTFTVTASALDHEPAAYGVAVAVIVERRDHARFPREILATRHHLTPRELDVARLLAGGASNDEIARSLVISPATARHHTEAVLAKLGLSSRARIASFLATLGTE